jgi:hypothetical protein
VILRRRDGADFAIAWVEPVIPIVAAVARGQDLSVAAHARAAWRVLLVGPDGREELFLDRETGKLLSSVTQGD